MFRNNKYTTVFLVVMLALTGCGQLATTTGTWCGKFRSRNLVLRDQVFQVTALEIASGPDMPFVFTENPHGWTPNPVLLYSYKAIASTQVANDDIVFVRGTGGTFTVYRTDNQMLLFPQDQSKPLLHPDKAYVAGRGILVDNIRDCHGNKIQLVPLSAVDAENIKPKN